jgi:hypothetical protein
MRCRKLREHGGQRYDRPRLYGVHDRVLHGHRQSICVYNARDMFRRDGANGCRYVDQRHAMRRVYGRKLLPGRRDRKNGVQCFGMGPRRKLRDGLRREDHMSGGAVRRKFRFIDGRSNVCGVRERKL